MRIFILCLWVGSVWADPYQETIQLFKNSGESAHFFDSAYAYAVFPEVGKGGFFIGAAYGKGRVYEQGQYIGDVEMTQLNLGLLGGGQVYRQIIFMQDKRALQEFISGSFEFGAGASAVIITAAAAAQASTAGASSVVSGGQHDAKTYGSKYNKGMAVFIIVKGGLMYEASIGGQHYKFIPKP